MAKVKRVLNAEQNVRFFEVIRNVAKSGGSRKMAVAALATAGLGVFEENDVSAKMTQARKALEDTAIALIKKNGLTGEKLVAFSAKMDAKRDELYPVLQRGRQAGQANNGIVQGVFDDLLAELDSDESTESTENTTGTTA